MKKLRIKAACLVGEFGDKNLSVGFEVVDC